MAYNRRRCEPGSVTDCMILGKLLNLSSFNFLVYTMATIIGFTSPGGCEVVVRINWSLEVKHLAWCLQHGKCSVTTATKTLVRRGVRVLLAFYGKTVLLNLPFFLI